MNMQRSFTEVMAQKPDEQLLKILAKPGDYQPEALEAARLEVEKRKLSSDRVEAVKKEVVIEQKQSTEKAAMPLEGGYKILSFIFPGVIPLMLSTALRTNGYERKASELLRWTFYGIAFYITIAVFIGLS
jgi:hypothetical protein